MSTVRDRQGHKYLCLFRKRRHRPVEWGVWNLVRTGVRLELDLRAPLERGLSRVHFILEFERYSSDLGGNGLTTASMILFFWSRMYLYHTHLHRHSYRHGPDVLILESGAWFCLVTTVSKPSPITDRRPQSQELGLSLAHVTSAKSEPDVPLPDKREEF